MKPRPLPGCLCFDSFVCSLHRSDPSAYAKEEADALDEELTKEFANGGGISRSLAHSDDCPWNPDDLPEHLRGYGHRMADQDGGNGSEWVTPQEDYEGQMIEAVKVLLDGREISQAP